MSVGSPSLFGLARNGSRASSDRSLLDVRVVLMRELLYGSQALRCERQFFGLVLVHQSLRNVGTQLKDP